MQPMNDKHISNLLNNLDKLGGKDYFVLSKQSIGTMKTRTGETVEATKYDRNKLNQMAVEDPDHFITKIDGWFREGRFTGFHDGAFVFREDIALLLGPEVTINIKGKNIPIEQQKTMQGRVESISEEDYDKVKSAIEAIKASLMPVEIQSTDKKERRPERTQAAAPPPPQLKEHRKEPVRANAKKQGVKEEVVASHATELQRQKEAGKKRRKEEKERLGKHYSKEDKVEDIQEYGLKKDRESTQKIKDDQKDYK